MVVEEKQSKPLVWIVASSDSCGGAGIQADVKAVHAMKAHAVTVIVAVTAQNSQQVFEIHNLEAGIIRSQIQMLEEDAPPRVIKLGLLPHASHIELTEELLSRYPESFVIADPILKSTSGDTLSGDGNIELYQNRLFKFIDFLTPNIHETEKLVGHAVGSVAAVENAAQELLERGIKAVVIKGGHFHEHPDLVCDYYADRAGKKVWLYAQRQLMGREARGTGCSMAAATAALVARGHEVLDSLTLSKSYISAALANSYAIGKGALVLDHNASPFHSAHFPCIAQHPQSWHSVPEFASMDGGPIGVYPVVDRCSWIARLKSQGITTIQLRVKDMQGDALEHEIAATCALARSLQVRLFVNDYWQLAIKHRAYGVHLGQEDLATLNADDLRTLAQSGLRLGLSTHSYEEAAVAHAIKPSYVALGPIFPTTCKSMAFGPHGIDKAPQWVTMLGCPIVAIGGLKVEHVAALRERGVDGVAVISDILYSNTPEQRASEWAQAFERAKFNV